MEVILKEDVINLGYKDDIVNVKRGYGRNYLIPTGKAVIATESARKVLAENLRQRAHKLAQIKANAEELAAKINDITLTIKAKTSSTGTIFGSVNNIQVAEELAKLGHEVDRKIIVIKDNIKEVGTYTAVVKLHKEVSATINLNVVSENNEDPVTSRAVYKAIKSNSGSGGSFYITLTQDSEGNYTTDKTFAETLTAYNKGKSLYMIYSDYILPLVQNTNSSIFIFSCLKDFTSSADKTAASLSYLSLYFSEGGVSVHSDSTNKFIDDRQKGAAKGIATLDENVKIPVAQIPDEIARMENVNTAIQSAIGNALGGSY